VAVVRSVPIVLATALGLALVGCSGGDDGTDLGPAASAPTASPAASTIATDPAPTTATVGADPFAIPDVIDAAYVNRVLAALYAVDGDITREILRTRSAGPGVVEQLAAIYGEPQLTLEIDGLARFLREDPAKFRDPPGDRIVTVMEVVAASDQCVIAVGDLSLAQVAPGPAVLGPGERYLVSLAPRTSRPDEARYNPTPFLIIGAEVLGPGESPIEEAPCG